MKTDSNSDQTAGRLFFLWWNREGHWAISWETALNSWESPGIDAWNIPRFTSGARAAALALRPL